MPNSATVAAAGRGNRLPCGGPWFIYLGQGGDTPNAETMIDNPAAVRTASAMFDGAAVAITPVASNVMSPTSVSEATILAEFTGWTAADFGTHTHNFAVVYWIGDTYGPGGTAVDWTNNTHWATIASNWGNLASALESVGKFDGIFFDNEAYSTVPYTEDTYPFNWGGDSNGPTDTAANGKGILPAHTRTNAFNLVYQRGEEIMNAVLDAWPSCKVLHTHQPYSSDHYMQVAAEVELDWTNNLFWAVELKAPFFYGMMNRCVVRNQGAVIDGGEIYGIRSEYDQWWAHRFRTYEAPRVANQFTYTDTLAEYRPLVSVAVYDRDEHNSFTLQAPDDIRDQIVWAIRQSGSYPWMYTETHDWYGAASVGAKTTAPSNYVTAVTEGRRIGLTGVVHDPDPGGGTGVTWTDDFNSTAGLTNRLGTVSVTSGKLRGGSVDTDIVATQTGGDAAATDQYVEVVVSACSGASYAGCVLRYSTGTGAYYMFSIVADGSCEIWHWTGSAYALLNSAAGTLGTMPGTLRAEVQGTALRLYWRDVLKVSATNGSLASGLMGTYHYPAGALSTSELESVEGGTL